ncbi:MAG: hypothetical protein NTW04_00685 [Elusimicrobia bacterium]|nr:hypothetical protein [Elusimicrobiota bacterium]
MNKTLRIIFTRHQAIILLTALFVAVLSCDLGSETVSMTTFYPDAYGAFAKMRVPGTVTVGNANTLTLGVGGTLFGFSANAGTDIMFSAGSTTTAGAIVIAPSNGRFQLDTSSTTTAGASIENFCVWKYYTVLTGVGNAYKKTDCTTNPTLNGGKWYALAVGYSAGVIDSSSSNQIKSGYMLCCKFTSLDYHVTS